MGKYPPPLLEIMRDEGPGGEMKKCLDLGCGNGSWWVLVFLRLECTKTAQDHGLGARFPSLRGCRGGSRTNAVAVRFSACPSIH